MREKIFFRGRLVGLFFLVKFIDKKILLLYFGCDILFLFIIIFYILWKYIKDVVELLDTLM